MRGAPDQNERDNRLEGPHTRDQNERDNRQKDQHERDNRRRKKETRLRGTTNRRPA